MKGLFALVLLGVFAAVHGRSTALVSASSGSLAALGDHPWLVHLRLAVATSGYLSTCAGSLISRDFVLTTADCLFNSRFVWIRYGVVNVVNPELVTEASVVHVHPAFISGSMDNNIGLISINRIVHFTSNIGSIVIERPSDPAPGDGSFCGFGAIDDQSPGERLTCHALTVSAISNVLVAADNDGRATEFDVGGAFVSNGVQVAVLSHLGHEGAAVFLRTGSYGGWIQSITGYDPSQPQD